MTETEHIEGWEPTRKSFRPKSDEPTVRVSKQAGAKKATFKKITPSDAASWWDTAFEVTGDMVGLPDLWKLEPEEAKKLGKPTATVYNEMPEKLRRLFGIENMQQGAFIFACLQLGWYLKKSIYDERIQPMQQMARMAQAMTADDEPTNGNDAFDPEQVVTRWQANASS
jgi:hypothetical protein